jgi:hypothetical protein
VTVYRWHCPPSRGPRPAGTPWCDDLPCRGHKATKEQLRAAQVLAWGDGLDDVYTPQGDPTTQADYLATAVEALHAIARGRP